MEDHVGAGLVHGAGDDLGLVGSVEAGEVTVGGDVLHVDDDLGLGSLGAGDVARLELLDEVVLDTTDEAHGARGRLECRRGADQERALLFGEDVVADVVGLDDGVDRDVRRVGVGLGDQLDAVGVGEADSDDRAVAALGEELEVGLAILVLGGRELLRGFEAQFVGGLVEAGDGGVVERLVAAAGEVERQADLDVGRLLGAVAAGVGRRIVLVVAAGRAEEADCGGECDER